MINERYIIKNKLGEGRSRVYLCTDLELYQKEFAVKILPNDKDSQEKKLFKDEFFSLKKLDHPLIVKPYDLGTVVKTDEEKEAEFLGSRFFTLEYFPGTELIHFPGVKDPRTLKEIIIQICSVLYYLHQSNYIYYDLKPENILAAEANGINSVKLIDLGLASHLSSGPAKIIKGTSEYIAPEILREEVHDFKVDLYSLGILLYRLVYNCFPFGTGDKLEIFKAHLEKEFEFPAADYPPVFINIMRKLLDKDPGKRYSNSLQVIRELNSGIDNLSPKFVPAKIFAGKKDIINILSSFITDKESSELFVVKGSEGSGKTSLLNEMYSINERVVPVFNTAGKTGFDFIKLFIKDLVFNEFVFPQLPEELKEKIDNFLYGSVVGVIDEIKAIISQVTINSKFILLIDNFNRFDRFSWEIFREIVPILQVNCIKVIAAEDSDYESCSKSLHNTKELILNPFTEMHVNEFIEKSFAPSFPRAELGKLILVYSDLLPGSIIRFIHDLVFLKIIRFDDGIPDVKSDETPVIETILKSSQEEIYNIRLNSLTDKETKAARYIAGFEAPVEPFVLGRLLNLEPKAVLQILENLLRKNIIQLNQQSGIPVITSEGFKKYIYSTIPEKKEFHNGIAKILEKIAEKEVNRNETARHYELAGNYSKVCSLLLDEAAEAGKLSAFSYQKKIYHHLLRLPLDEKNQAKIKYNLAYVHYKLSEFQNCLGLVNELLQIRIIDEKMSELLILKGSCLVELGKYREGKEILNALLSKIKDKVQKLKLLTEIANAEFELGRYKEVKKICDKILASNHSEVLDRGRCLSLLGNVEIINNNELERGLKYFIDARKTYLDSNLKSYSAGMEINIGNIYSMKGLDEKAKENWNKSLNAYRQMGNIIREANILNNFGIYHYKNAFFENAKEDYTRASIIYKTLGSRNYEGLVLINLGELFFLNCEYQNALDTIRKAIEIFLNINKVNHELDSLFLLGEVLFSIGDYNELKKIINKYDLLLNSAGIQEKNKDNYKLLNCLTESVNSSKDIAEELKIIRSNFLKLDNEFQYIFVTILISKLLLNLNEYDTVLEELSSQTFLEFCKKNYFFEAEREYFIGRVAERKSSSNLENALSYYESAYSKIKESQVTELTWELLFSLGMHYFRRGNRNKAKDYFYYSKSVIFNIADSFTDLKLKEAYLRKTERKSALEIMLNELS